MEIRERDLFLLPMRNITACFKADTKESVERENVMIQKKPQKSACFPSAGGRGWERGLELFIPANRWEGRAQGNRWRWALSAVAGAHGSSLWILLFSPRNKQDSLQEIENGE